MSEQREAFWRDVHRAWKDLDHWDEILLPWIGVERPVEYAGATGVEVLVSVATPGILELERRLVLPMPAEHITFHFEKEKP